MSVAWIILLVLSVVLSVALIVFYEIYVYRRQLAWAQILSTIAFLVILGLWLAFAVVYYKSTKASTRLLCSAAACAEASCMPACSPDLVESSCSSAADPYGLDSCDRSRSSESVEVVMI